MSGEIYRIGAIIPMSGVSGIYGPSCKSCITLAQEEINERGGIGGRRVEIAFIDGDRGAAEVGRDIRTLLDTKALHALIGTHNSDVRKAVSNVNDGRVVYVYTPTYEGGHIADGLICIGDTPRQQIRPAMKWFKENQSLKNWIFIGSDYSWPRQLRSYLETIAAAEGFNITKTHFVDVGTTEFGEYVDGIEEFHPDGVFFALVGDEAVNFNREFGQRSALVDVMRFGPLIEENTLLAIGKENAGQIYSAGSYFPSVQSDRNDAFKRRYYDRLGESAPELNTLSVSSYAGLHLLVDLLPVERSYDVGGVMSKLKDRHIDAVVSDLLFKSGKVSREIFLANAVDNHLRIVHSFGELSVH